MSRGERREDDGGRSADPDEPLVASRDPAARLGPAPTDARRGRPWALAVLSVLLLGVTTVVVVQAVRPAEVREGTSGAPAAAAPTGSPSVVGEAPAGGVEPNIPTAELPPGGAFPVQGAGRWHVVPGAAPQVGQGRVFTYTVEVEDGAVLPEGDGAFATAVDATLADPRSWIGSRQIAMRRVDRGTPDFRVSLSSQLTTRRECGYAIRYEASCWQPGIGRVILNGARWVRGAGAFEGQLGLYRQYAVNHEVGHVFRNPHVPCSVPNALAPVMMQQSFGTSNDYLAQLTEENPQGTQIPRDGKTCRPNAWPFPPG